MAKNRYSKKLKRLYWILIVLILPGFIIWGSEVLIQHHLSKNYAGIVFGKKISFDEFNQALGAVRHQLIFQKGKEFLKLEKDIDISPQVWDRLILLKEAERRKIKVSDREVREYIRSLPIFLRDNEFDFSLYQQILKYLLHTEPRIFEEETRENLIISKLYDEITKDVELTEEEIELAYRHENEMIAIEYLSLEPKQIEKDIHIEEEKLINYYHTNRQSFQEPPAFNIQYITEQDPQKIKLIYQQLKKVKNFEKILKEKGYQINETGFFSLEKPIPGLEWPISFYFLIENLKVGEISSPIKVKDKYFLLYLKQKREAFIPNFLQIKDMVKEKFLQEEKRKIAYETLNKILSEIKNRAQKNMDIDFPQIAKEFNLQYGSTEMFKRSSYIPQIGSSDRFFAVFEELKPQSIGKEILETEQAMFIVKIKDYQPVDQEVYKKEKEEFSRDLLNRVKNQRFLEFLWQLRQKADVKIRL